MNPRESDIPEESTSTNRIPRREALMRLAVFFALAAVPIPHAVWARPASLPDGSMIRVRDYMRPGEIDALPAWSRVLSTARETRHASILADGLSFSEAPSLPAALHWTTVWSQCLFVTRKPLIVAGDFAMDGCAIFTRTEEPAIYMPSGTHNARITNCYLAPANKDAQEPLARATRDIVQRPMIEVSHES